MKRFVFLFAMMFTFSVTFVACGGSEEATDEGTETTEETTEVAEETAPEVDLTKGLEVYTASCQVCHQAEGAGLGEAFPAVKGLTDKATILDNIKNGLESGNFPAAMAAVELSEEDANAVADYVLSLK